MGSGPFPHFPSREITLVVEKDFKPYEWMNDFGEVHAGYVFVAGTDIITWTSVSGSFKSEHDFVHVHSD